VSLVIQ